MRAPVTSGAGVVAVVVLTALAAAVVGPGRSSAAADPRLIGPVVVSAPVLPPADGDLVVGLTHTHHGPDQCRDPALPDTCTPAVRRALGLLGQVAVQNQHLYGFGTLNPWPDPDGPMDWSSLDARMDRITASGATPVLTLCCAPPWMTECPPGTWEWFCWARAPRPDRVAAFATLAEAAVARYAVRNGLRHVIVWNELKGYWHGGGIDTDAYLTLYDAVHERVEAVGDRLGVELAVGGPYVPMVLVPHGGTDHPSDLQGPWGVLDRRPLEAFEAWWERKRGADFVVVSGWSGVWPTGEPQTCPVRAVEVFGAVTAWLRARMGAEAVPIWWSEFFPVIHQLDSPDQDPSDPAQAAVVQAAVDVLDRAGAAVALVWNETAATSNVRWLALWGDTADPDDPRAGEPTAVYRALFGGERPAPPAC